MSALHVQLGTFNSEVESLKKIIGEQEKREFLRIQEAADFKHQVMTMQARI